MTESDPPPPPPPGAEIPLPPEKRNNAHPAPTFSAAHSRSSGEPDPDNQDHRTPTGAVGSQFRRRQFPLPLALGGVAVVAVIALLAFVGLTGSDGDAALNVESTPLPTQEVDAQATDSEPQGPETLTTPEPEAPPPTVVSTSDPPTTTLPPSTLPPTTVAPTPPLDPEYAALEQLQTIIASDAPLVTSVAENWVPQLGAKQLGTVWEGVEYDYQQILAGHQQSRELYGAVLVDGATYNFRQSGEPMAGWFITLVPQGYPDAEGALAWCTAQRIDQNNCFAKLLTQNQDAGQTIRLND